MKQGAIIEMKDGYPFGELKEVAQSEGEALVRKKLTYQGPAQLEIIKKMIGLLDKLKHDQLIRLQNYDLAGEETVYFYYQYVPLTLQKWILDLGDDILEELQKQMLDLTRYLAKQDIKYHFDPKCIGLSKEIKVKYFMQQFMVDNQNQNEYYEQTADDIKSFFKEFRLMYSENDDISTDFTERKSADSALLQRMGMLNDRGSWQTGMRKIGGLQKSKKSALLSQKIQNSKKKSMQILMRLKAMKPKSQE